MQRSMNVVGCSAVFHRDLQSTQRQLNGIVRKLLESWGRLFEDCSCLLKQQRPGFCKQRRTHL